MQRYEYLLPPYVSLQALPYLLFCMLQEWDLLLYVGYKKEEGRVRLKNHRQSQSWVNLPIFSSLRDDDATTHATTHHHKKRNETR